MRTIINPFTNKMQKIVDVGDIVYIQSNTFRSTEGSGSSTVTSWQLRLARSGRSLNYWGNIPEKVISAKYFGVIGLKGDGSNTVSGKIRFSGMNDNPFDGPVHANNLTDWRWWYESIDIPISGLFLNGVSGGAYQSGVMISSTGGKNYYYSGFSELRIYLHA